jgi:hypothetical protein
MFNAIYSSGEKTIQINILEFLKIKWTLEASDELKKTKRLDPVF